MVTKTVRPDLTIVSSPATDEGMADDQYEQELMSTYDYEQTLATAGLEPTRDGEAVQPLGTRDMLQEVFEETGRQWVPTRITGSQTKWVEEYRTDGAVVSLDEGEWRLFSTDGLPVEHEIMSERDDDRQVLMEAHTALSSWEQHLQQKLQQKGIER